MRSRITRRWTTRAVLAAGAAALAALPQPASAAGFGIFEQGSKAMGMAGAFTAQADDPSAMFHNPGGLAFLDERDFMAGTTLISYSEAEFTGAAPFPGEGQGGEFASAVFYPSHAYWAQPISDTLVFGLAFNNPFGLTTEWDDVDTFPGRFVSYYAELRTFDLTPNIGWRIGDFGVGAGVVARFSDVTLKRRVGLSNPFNNSAIDDVADAELESDLENAYGFNVGLLHRYNNSFSWGLSYRSAIETDYSGEATFTQIATGTPLDAVVGTVLPLGTPVDLETSIETPAMASLGVAIALSPDLFAEVDVNWTGWSSFDTLVIDFDDAADPQGRLDSVRPQDWEDVYNYRLGLRWTRGNTEWRAGYVYDETPQPRRVAGPLLPDNDRQGITVGYGWQGDRLYTDIAVMYLPFDDTEVTPQTGSEDGVFGTYEITGWLLGVTLGWK